MSGIKGSEVLAVISQTREIVECEKNKIINDNLIVIGKINLCKKKTSEKKLDTGNPQAPLVFDFKRHFFCLNLENASIFITFICCTDLVAVAIFASRRTRLCTNQNPAHCRNLFK